jgi:glycosyltransferase involved in cell wall biosynthesis
MRHSKLVVLIGHFGRGGCERQAYLLARHWRQRHGLDVEVWSLIYGGHDEAYAKEFEAAGIPVRVVGFEFPNSYVRVVRHMKWAWQVHRFARQLRKCRVKILLPFTTWPNVVAGLTYRFAGVKLCIWGERHCGGERVPTAEWIAVRQFRRFVANSTAGGDFLASEMRVPRERIAFAPNGVEALKVHPDMNWRERLGLSPGQLLVVKVANVTEFKDHSTLLRAWKIVQDSWTNGERPVLALAGQYHPNPLYQNCLKIVREGGLDSTVRFLGSIPDVAALLQASDLTAFSSPGEGMPNGVLECMAAGKAIVASDLPGVRDALGPNIDGVLVSPGDHVRFAQILLELLRNKEKREALGAANRARIREEFSVERMAERYLAIVQEEWGPSRSNAAQNIELPRTQNSI